MDVWQTQQHARARTPEKEEEEEVHRRRRKRERGVRSDMWHVCKFLGVASSRKSSTDVESLHGTLLGQNSSDVS